MVFSHLRYCKNSTHPTRSLLLSHKPLCSLLIFSQWVMAIYGQVSFTMAMVIEGGSGVTQSFRASVISLPYGYYFIPLSSIPLVCQQCTHKACRLCFAGCFCWWCRNWVYRFHGQLMAQYNNHQLSSRGLPFMILVHNKAVGQTDCCWTRECLNKSSRWASLLWASLVSHLFIAPLSLISSHCLLYWHKPLCPVRPRWCLIQLPRRLLCRLRTRVVPEQNTCPPLALCAEMSFETPKIYGRCSNIRRQMCSRNSSSHDTSSAQE